MHRNNYVIYTQWNNFSYISTCTVNPPIVDPLNNGHCIFNLSVKDTALGPKNHSPYRFNALRTSEG